MAEKEYIERSEVIRTILRQPPEHYPELYYRDIKELPAADVVEVCRCKDCKHCVKYKCKNDACYSFTICRRRDGYAEDVEEDDFCSHGERKEQE